MNSKSLLQLSMIFVILFLFSFVIVKFNEISSLQELTEKKIDICCTWGTELKDGVLTYTIKKDNNSNSDDIERIVNLAFFEWKKNLKNIQFKNVKTGTPLPLDNKYEKFAGTQLPLDELEKLGGTRLRSALWFCKSYPNVIAFIVSQDQEMKVLWSEEEAAFAFVSIAMSTIPQFA